MLQGACAAEPDCVRIYYDRPAKPGAETGPTYALFLQNLLGHFPDLKPNAQPVVNYRRGEIEQCRASFYIGSDYASDIPEDFLIDFARATKPVVWMNYSIWRYDAATLERLFGHRFSHITGLDWEKRDAKGRPGFYRQIHYRGEVFTKYGELSEGSFSGPFEMIALSPTGRGATVLAEAAHDTSGARLPYVVRKGNHYYVADVPFAFKHESDRYLVFADLLFDVLNAPERRSGKKKPALFRIEDVSSASKLVELLEMGELLHELRVPFHVALIPIFSDPLGKTGKDPTGAGVPLNEDLALMAALKELRRLGATFIWHGVTHQYGAGKNPFSGVSGEDFEFWDMPANRPLAQDTPDDVLARMELGWLALESAGMKPRIWEVPHYQASVLDYYLFSRLFQWNIGRISYASHSVSGAPPIAPGHWFETTGSGGAEARHRAFQGLSVTTQSEYFGQFFPYEIDGDVYGQKVIPENLGYPGGPNATDPSRTRTVDDIISGARRNRVLRDAWASFFLHVNFPVEGAASPDEARRIRLDEIRRLVASLRNEGYEFVSADKFGNGGCMDCTGQ